MNVTLAITRQNAATNGKPEAIHYTVDVQPTDRILDALMDITQNQDGTLGYRRSCAHGVCGSDAMRINGKERLACKTLFKDVVEDQSEPITVEPLRHLPVQKDLLVDQSAFFEKFHAVKPFFVPKAATPEHGEYLQSPEERELIDEATKCISCGACYSACPILDQNPAFLGPQAIVQAARFVYDSRDQGLPPRLEALDTPNGIWPCQSKFECTKVCPREIKITKLINFTKRKIKTYRQERGERTAEEGTT